MTAVTFPKNNALEPSAYTTGTTNTSSTGRSNAVEQTPTIQAHNIKNLYGKTQLPLAKNTVSADYKRIAALSLENLISFIKDKAKTDNIDQRKASSSVFKKIDHASFEQQKKDIDDKIAEIEKKKAEFKKQYEAAKAAEEQRIQQERKSHKKKGFFSLFKNIVKCIVGAIVAPFNPVVGGAIALSGICGAVFDAGEHLAQGFRDDGKSMTELMIESCQHTFHCSNEVATKAMCNLNSIFHIVGSATSIAATVLGGNIAENTRASTAYMINDGAMALTSFIKIVQPSLYNGDGKAIAHELNQALYDYELSDAELTEQHALLEKLKQDKKIHELYEKQLLHAENNMNDLLTSILENLTKSLQNLVTAPTQRII